MSTETPSQQLAREIFEALQAEGLIAEQDRDSLLPKLAEGRMKAEDWRLAIETAQEKGARS